MTAIAHHRPSAEPTSSDRGHVSVIGSASVDASQVRSRAVRSAAVHEGAAVMTFVVVILVVVFRE
jgi:hypothetical protein